MGGVKAPCAKCGQMSEFSRKSEMLRWVYCTRCKLYTVPKLRLVTSDESH
jgi:hypothetical protein